MNKQLRHFFDWVAVIAWMGMIYYFSNQPDLKTALEPGWDYILRKGAHFLEYFTLCYFLYRAIRGHGVGVRLALVLSVTFAAAYALSDEWHQGWITGRIASPIDVLIDTLGALTCAVLLFRRGKTSR